MEITVIFVKWAVGPKSLRLSYQSSCDLEAYTGSLRCASPKTGHRGPWTLTQPTAHHATQQLRGRNPMSWKSYDMNNGSVLEPLRTHCVAQEVHGTLAALIILLPVCSHLLAFPN